MSNVDLLTTRDVAAALKVSTREVARRVKTGALEPAVQLPGIRGAYLFDPSVVSEVEGEFGKRRRTPEPVTPSEYASLIREFVDSDDPHDRYRLRDLVRWHVPTPWRTWFAFSQHLDQMRNLW